MPAITSYAPLEARGKLERRSHMPTTQLPPRPQSQMSDATEILETDFEDDGSDFETTSHKGSFESISDGSRRRSQTTISSFNEAATPDPVANDDNQFEIRFRPVEGPSGPHLFRFSSTSAEFEFKNALQMSPIMGPKVDPLNSRQSHFDPVATPATATYLGGMSFEDAFQQAILDDEDDELIEVTEDQIRTWSAQEVIDWMYDAGLDASIIECFIHHDITGEVLYDLAFDDLKELDIQSFGKRRQLWSALCMLRGDDDNVRPTSTAPSQELHRSNTRSSKRSPSRSRGRPSLEQTPEEEMQSITRSMSSATNKRRGRKSTEQADEVLPAESISIVAIEQLLPKPHECAKGENCSKWRKQQRQLQQLKDEHGIDYFPDRAANNRRILIAGNTAKAAASAEGVNITNPHLLQPSLQECAAQIPLRPNSEAMPSVVASSDLFGPSQAPEFVLQESTLNQLGARDPQDNVKQFLTFQHVNSPAHPPAEYGPTSPVMEMFPSRSVAAFPAAQKTNAPVRPSTANPHEQLRSLPKLDIPRSMSAGPRTNQLVSPQRSALPQNAITSPVTGPSYRMGTPASEMDVPYMATPMAPPVSRDASQSVPPNMQFNQPVRLSGSHSRTGKADWRRPSMTLPAVKEGEVLAAQQQHRQSSAPSSGKSSHELARPGASTTAQRRRTLDPAKDDPETKHFGYGPDCSHAGWMRKRRTKLLRHEWQDAHFRLKGTQLAMHENARLSSQAKETIDVDKYAVACSNAPSSSKLSAAMKVFNIKSSDDKDAKKDATAFAFQLVPTAGKSSGAMSRASAAAGKTHHFAVNTKDERIDWMRELMLAKALQAKGKGYEVEVNGVAA